MSSTKTPQNQFFNITTTFNLHFGTFKLFSLFFFEGFPYLPEIALKNQRKLLKVDLRRQLDKNMKGIFHIF